MLPSQLRLLVAPAEAAEPTSAAWPSGSRRVAGLDLSPVRAAAANRHYPARLTESQLLAPAAAAWPPPCAGPAPPSRRIGGSMTVDRRRGAGTMHGCVRVLRLDTGAGHHAAQRSRGLGDIQLRAHVPADRSRPSRRGRGGRDRDPGGRLRRPGVAVEGHRDVPASGQRRRAEQSTLFAGRCPRTS